MRFGHQVRISKTSFTSRDVCDVIECDRLSAIDLTISRNDDTEEGRKEILEKGQVDQ